MSRWDISLEGGPFDGDNGSIDPPLPPRIWVEPCPRGICGTHWYRESERGCEVYKFHEQDDEKSNAKYVYAGLDLGGGGNELTEEVDHGQGAEKHERELIPA